MRNCPKAQLSVDDRIELSRLFLVCQKDAAQDAEQRVMAAKKALAV